LPQCTNAWGGLDERFPELFGFNFWSDDGFHNVVGSQNEKELINDPRIATLDSKNRLKRK
jgi:hypothetical protein